MNLEYKSLKYIVEQKVAYVTLNRPDKANALDQHMWDELRSVFQLIDLESVRAVILAGEGKHFCAGIDLELLQSIGSLLHSSGDIARKAEQMRQKIRTYQQTFTVIEKCRKPVIALIHGSCLGGAMSMITACDLRLSTDDAKMAVSEIDRGLAADVGVLQRLASIVGEGHARDLVFTGRAINGQEALRMALVNQSYASREQLLEAGKQLADQLAEKSPVAMRGTKQMMNYARDHSIDAALDYMATWNASMLMTEDIQKAIMAYMAKQKADFQD